jgi:hypothetical protein
VAVGTLAGMCLEVVGSPGLRSVYWSRDTLNWVLVEADESLLLGGRGVADDRRPGVAEVRHGVGC